MKTIKWISMAFFVIAVLITVVFFGWWSMKERFIFGHDAFDQVRWITPPSAQTPPCDRGDMVLDIQHRLLKRGMSKSEVTVLLGRPTWEESNQFEYDLGVCLWVVHGLRLYFDTSDRLVHTAITQH